MPDFYIQVGSSRRTELLFSMRRFFLTLPVFTALMLSFATAAESYLVMEANSARVLLASNSEKKRPVAGLAKIAAAKVALDWAKLSKASLTTKIVVPDSSLSFTGANPMGLRPGDQLSMRDAIYSAMLGSDDTAAHALAIHIGRELLIRRQLQGDAQKVFVAEMNNLEYCKQNTSWWNRDTKSIFKAREASVKLSI